MKYVQFAIFTFPLFNNRKGFAGLVLIFAFLIKILKGVLGELDQQKRRRKKKNLSCIPQALLMEETCCLFKSPFWWEKANGHVLQSLPLTPILDCFLFSCLQSSESLVPSLLSAQEDGAGLYAPCQAGRETNIHRTSQHSSRHPWSLLPSSQSSWQPSDEETEAWKEEVPCPSSLSL